MPRPSAKLGADVADVARPDQLAKEMRGAAPALLEAVRRQRSSSARTSLR